MKPKKFSPREAMKAASKLGWTVQPKSGTGDIVYTSPLGERFTSRAPGRADRVPIALAKALTAASAASP